LEILHFYLSLINVFRSFLLYLLIWILNTKNEIKKKKKKPLIHLEKQWYISFHPISSLNLLFFQREKKKGKIINYPIINYSFRMTRFSFNLSISIFAGFFTSLLVFPSMRFTKSYVDSIAPKSNPTFIFK